MDTAEVSLKWSAHFSVSPSSHSLRLPGDKVTLPASALEALLSASSALAAEHVRSNLPAYDPYNSATYSAYRQAESQYQDQRQQLPYPLTFRLVNPANRRVVYAGIREFSAEEGEVELSPFLREALGLSSEENERKDTALGLQDTEGHDAVRDALSTVTVHAKQLPKGTYVKLRPLEPGYDPEDWKALLEQHLRTNYTTLTNGEVLVVPGARGMGGKKEEFRFVVDGFKRDTDGICIVDTDLEVDIEALNEEQARETLKRIRAKISRAPGTDQGTSAGGDLDLFHPQEGQVLPGEYVDYRLPSWNRSQILELELELSGGDEENEVDLLLNPFSITQRAKPRIDEYVFANFEGRPKKKIRLEASNVELEHAEALFVSVHAFSPVTDGTDADGEAQGTNLRPRRFVLRAKHADPTVEERDLESKSGREPTADEVHCKNCHQIVPKQSLFLHENYCLRNNILCPKGCGDVFQKRSPQFASHWHCPHDTFHGNTGLSKQKHDALYHPIEPLICPDCCTSQTFTSLPLLAHHRTTTCPAKLILCRFCHLEVPQEGDPDVPNAEALLSGLTPHELADGARTTECHLCNKITRLRDMDTHLKHHNLERLSRQAPRLCRNVNCARTLDVCSRSGDTRAGTRMGQGPGNDIGLCSQCFGPLYVSMYDPENKALKRRIERRYLSQLVTGCGKSWCRNEYCKTGRMNVNGISVSIPTKDALPIVKPFIALKDGVSLHFCVDETSQKRRVLAEMLAAEPDISGKGGYALEWCVGALEAESGVLDAARLWLKNWAPRRAEEHR